VSHTFVIDSIYSLTAELENNNIVDDVTVKVGAYSLKRLLIELANNSDAAAKGFHVVVVGGQDTIVLTLKGLTVTVTK
jgi:hypothetical protein